MNSINELPDTVAAGDTGHPITHEVIHAGLKDHETRIASTEADISAKADLVGGKVPASQIPDIAITDFLGEVASESEMNALSGQKGDWAVRTDTGTQWILISDNEWKEMVSPSSPVQSVAGKTGAVTLAKTDVGLSNVDNTSDANKPVSTAVNTALQGKANSSHTHTIDEVTGLQAGLDGKSGTDHKHAAADITSGTFAIARIPTGTTASTVAVGNDPRLSDTRTPKTHDHEISGVNGLEDALDAKADLVDGKVPAGQLPESEGGVPGVAVDMPSGGTAALATGELSTALGPSTSASGYGSTAIGMGALAPNHMQITMGADLGEVGSHEVHIPGTLVLYSPDRTMWAINVSDTGEISATEWTPPNVSPLD